MWYFPRTKFSFKHPHSTPCNSKCCPGLSFHPYQLRGEKSPSSWIRASPKYRAVLCPKKQVARRRSWPLKGSLSTLYYLSSTSTGHLNVSRQKNQRKDLPSNSSRSPTLSESSFLSTHLRVITIKPQTFLHNHSNNNTASIYQASNWQAR